MITLDKVTKQFKNESDSFLALNNVSVRIPENQITIISGPSGSGKSTLLSIIGLLQSATLGDIYFGDDRISNNDLTQKRKFIRENISYVFQEFNLIDDFSVVDNLLIVCDDLWTINKILETIGLIDKKSTPTKLLSGGEKQRLAIGRAIAKSGNIILLDEPTGNLDEENGKVVFTLLKQFAKTKTIVVVTHDLKLAYNYADYVILLNSGKLISSFSLSQNKLDIDFSKVGIDSLIPLMDLVKYQSSVRPINLLIQAGDNKKVYSVTYDSILSVFSTISNDFEGQKVSIEVLDDLTESETLANVFNINNAKHIFPFKYLLKYAALLFKNKIWRNLASIVLLILNIVMIFVYTTIANFDYVSSTKKAILENEAYYAQPYILETNEISNELNRYFSGNNIYEAIEKANMEAMPVLRVDSGVANIQLSLTIIDKPTYFLGTLITPPSLDSVVITDFVSHFIDDQTTIMVSNNTSRDLVFSCPLKIERSVKCNYNAQDITNFTNNPNYQTLNKDKFFNSYSIAFISSETFTKMKQCSEHSLSAANFFMSTQVTKLYAEESTKYALFDNNNLLAGRNPAEPYEVVISSSFFEHNAFYTGHEKVEDILELEFNYKNLNDSPNRDIYQTIMNIYEVTPKVKIVGVTDDNTDEVYISESFMNEILSHMDHYLSGFFVNLQQDIDKIELAGKYNVYYDLSYLEPIVLMNNLSRTDLFYILLTAIAIILTSTVIFLAITFILNVKEKYKEIAIIKSFGVSKKRIAGMFILLNSFIATLSLMCGLLLSVLALHCVNSVLMSPNVFSINYSILGMTPLSFAIVIVITLFSSFISTIIALRKVNKIDVALALKLF